MFTPAMTNKEIRNEALQDYLELKTRKHSWIGQPIKTVRIMTNIYRHKSNRWKNLKKRSQCMKKTKNVYLICTNRIHF